MKATWNDTVIAESDSTVFLEGNHYFPMDCVNQNLLRPSRTHSNCPWKGQASYYSIVVGDAVNKDAAWHYADPKPAAAAIANHVAFWRGVDISD